jgi:hypothetical protein
MATTPWRASHRGRADDAELNPIGERRGGREELHVPRDPVSRRPSTRAPQDPPAGSAPARPHASPPGARAAPSRRGALPPHRSAQRHQRSPDRSPGEAVFRPRRGQVVADRPAEGKEGGGDLDANHMQAVVAGTRVAAAVAKEACQRRYRTGQQRPAQHVARLWAWRQTANGSFVERRHQKSLTRPFRSQSPKRGGLGPGGTTDFLRQLRGGGPRGRRIGHRRGGGRGAGVVGGRLGHDAGPCSLSRPRVQQVGVDE